MLQARLRKTFPQRPDSAGFSLDVEPGLICMKGKNTWSFSVPVPFLRDRTRSVPDIIDNRHGDAAFADYVLLIGYSRRF